MSDYYCTVAIEKSNVDEVRKVIEMEIGKPPFDICIEVEDRGEVYSYTSSFMMEQNITETDPVLKELDLAKFTTDVDIYCTEDSFGLKILDMIADAIACFISRSLNTRTLVTLTNQETPFCMFNCGQRENVFIEQNRNYFDKKFWIPRV